MSLTPGVSTSVTLSFRISAGQPTSTYLTCDASLPSIVTQSPSFFGSTFWFVSSVRCAVATGLSAHTR